jgi:parallel beta-helix repeat protein
MKNIKIVVCFISFFILCMRISATTWRVPSQCPHIQAGIDSASTADTVLVADGTYTGSGNRDIDFGGKAILVISENGSGVTIIDCQADSLNPHRGFYFHSGEDSNSIVSGFTIKHGHEWQFPNDAGGAVYCENSSPTIESNLITDNYAHNGAGIYCEYADPIIRNNTLMYDTAQSYGGAILCLNCSPTIMGNTITHNTAGTNGGGIYLHNSDCLIDSNKISENTATYWHGGGIYGYYYSDATITKNTITLNTAGQFGGGLYFDWYSHPNIENNIISQNTSVLQGGGIHLSESSPTIKNNMIVDNTGQHGGGIYCEWMSSPDITDNLITDNTASWGGGIYCYSQCSPNVERTTFTNNMTTGIGGNGAGIYCYISCSLTVVNCIVWGDSALPGAGEIYQDGSSNITITYSDVEGGWAGVGNIDADPLFVSGPLGNYYLSQIAAGQAQQSPCVDSGNPGSLIPNGTTRTDQAPDATPIDMGYHYPIGTGIFEDNHGNIHNGQYLHQNYPNPCRSFTTIDYSVIAPTHISLSIYDVCGKIVRRLVNKTMPAGQHEVIWDGCDNQGYKVSSGVYFYQLGAGDYVETRRLIFIR